MSSTQFQRGDRGGDTSTGVTSSANLADNSIIRGDGGALGIQDSSETNTEWDILDSGLMHHTRNSIAGATTESILLENPSDPALGTPERSPVFALEGSASDGVDRHPVKFGMQVVPEQASELPGPAAGSLQWHLSRDDAAYTENRMALRFDGRLTLADAYEGAVDLAGTHAITGDADGDTLLSATSDDQWRFQAGVGDIRMTSSAFFSAVSGVDCGLANNRWGGFHFSERLTVGTASVSADYSISSSDFLVQFTGSTIGQTLTLPAAASLTDGLTYVIVNDASVSVTIACDVGDTVEGSTTKTLAAGARCVLTYIDGTTNWVCWGFESGDL